MLVLLSTSAWANDWKTALPPSEKVAEYLQEISVNVKAGYTAGYTEGSGVVKTRPIGGKQVNFVWTAAHLLDGLRQVREVIDPKTGTKRQFVSFKDAQVVKELVEDGRRGSELKMDAAVTALDDVTNAGATRLEK